VTEPGPDPAADGADGADDADDDLARVQTPMSRLLAVSRRWLALLVAAALLLPTGAWLLDELRFRRSGAAVVETLEGELRGEDIADTVLLVRTVGCTPVMGGSGSAFVVDVGAGPVVATNRHVVEGARRVGIRNLDGTSTHRVVAVLVSETADVAVLEVADPEALPPALALDDTVPPVGQEVRLIGFPSARPFTTAGTVLEATPGQLLLELEVVPGASGSPLVTPAGAVVGQVHAITTEGLGVATPAAQLRRSIADARPVDPC
jgi:S1-C subfamily serine protease